MKAGQRVLVPGHKEYDAKRPGTVVDVDDPQDGVVFVRVDACTHEAAYVATGYLRKLVSPPSHADFPFHHKHVEAKCFKCNGELEDHSFTRQAPGNGNCRGVCQDCGYFTWYDCADDFAGMNRARHDAERRTQQPKKAVKCQHCGDTGDSLKPRSPTCGDCQTYLFCAHHMGCHHCASGKAAQCSS